METTKKSIAYSLLQQVKQVMVNTIDLSVKDGLSYAAVRTIDRILSHEKHYNRQLRKIHEETCMRDEKTGELRINNFTLEGITIRDEAEAILQDTPVEIELYKVDFTHARIAELPVSSYFYLDGILFDVPAGAMGENDVLGVTSPVIDSTTTPDPATTTSPVIDSTTTPDPATTTPPVTDSTTTPDPATTTATVTDNTATDPSLAAAVNNVTMGENPIKGNIPPVLTPTVPPADNMIPRPSGKPPVDPSRLPQHMGGQ